MKKLIVCLILFFSPLLWRGAGGEVFAQQQNYNWCFGDSAGIDFNNLGNPVAFQSAVNARGSCASVSDSLGNLLLYGGCPDGSTYITGSTEFGAVRNRFHDTIFNGINLKGQGTYHEIVLIPFPGTDSLYYFFSINVVGFTYGLYYSIINIKGNSGLGAVIQKNVQIMPDP